MICTGHRSAASCAQQQRQSGTIPSAGSLLNRYSPTTSDKESQWFWSKSSGQVFQHAPQLTHAMRSIVTFIRIFHLLICSWRFLDKGMWSGFWFDRLFSSENVSIPVIQKLNRSDRYSQQTEIITRYGLFTVGYVETLITKFILNNMIINNT